ncbi:MAG TPA: MFS transporter, partial [Candidatus Limnocylindrales bacterium]
MTRLRTLIGISVFWLALSMLGDGFTALVVPEKLAAVVPVGSLATAIGAVTFVGLVAGMLVQPVAGALSDSIAPRFGRTGVLIPAALLVLVALAAFAGLGSLPAIVVSFLLLQVALNIAQAAQQGFIPDRVASGWRGRAAGLKGLADVGGAFLGFALLAALVVGGDIRSAAVALGVVVVGTLVLTLVLVPRRLPPSSSTSRKDRHDGTQLDPERRAAFLRSVGARFLFLLGIYGIGRFLLLFVADRLGVDPTMAGGQTAIVFAGLTLWTAVASLPAGWIADRAGRTTTMCAGAAASAIGSLLLLAAPDVPANARVRRSDVDRFRCLRHGELGHDDRRRPGGPGRPAAWPGERRDGRRGGRGGPVRPRCRRRQGGLPRVRLCIRVHRGRRPYRLEHHRRPSAVAPGVAPTPFRAAALGPRTDACQRPARGTPAPMTPPATRSATRTGPLPTGKTPHQLSLPPSMAGMGDRSQLVPPIGLDVPAYLAQLLKPIAPIVKRIRYRRHGTRDHDPADVL